MRKKPVAKLVELRQQDLVSGRAERSDAVARAAAVLAGGGVLMLRVHPLADDKSAAIAQAEAALVAITSALRDGHRLPRDAYVELDEESYGTPVAPFRAGRFLLPHHDGGHCTYLTPSRHDVPDVDPAEREFSSTVYWKRPSHKMYQGFIVTNPGQPPGETFYYDVLTLLADAYAHQRGRAPNLFELESFNLENVRRSRLHRATHGSRYLTLGALLGSTTLEHHVMPSGPRAESEFWPAQYIALPGLCEIADACPCGTCDGPGVRLFCHMCVGTVGRTWPEFRAEYETRVVAEGHDVLIANNLTLLHAAISSASRTIRPLCIVTDRSEGEPYERWLAYQWRVWQGEPSTVAPSTAHGR
jgi:hypothetical protein